MRIRTHRVVTLNRVEILSTTSRRNTSLDPPSSFGGSTKFLQFHASGNASGKAIEKVGKAVIRRDAPKQRLRCTCPRRQLIGRKEHVTPDRALNSLHAHPTALRSASIGFDRKQESHSRSRFGFPPFLVSFDRNGKSTRVILPEHDFISRQCSSTALRLIVRHREADRKRVSSARRCASANMKSSRSHPHVRRDIKRLGRRRRRRRLASTRRDNSRKSLERTRASRR